MLSGDLYQIKDFQIMNGDATNPFLNVYYYRCQVPDPAMDAGDVEAEFQATVGLALLEVQSAFLQHVNHEVTNLMSLVDFISVGFVPPSGTGVNGGGFLPNALAWSFIYRRASLASRNGWKRIGGLPSDQVVNAAPVAGMLIKLQALADAMEATMTVGDAELRPVIVRKTPIVGGGTTYTHFAITGVSYDKIGTQNTRKR